MYNITGLYNGTISGILTTLDTSTQGMFMGLSTLAIFFVFVLSMQKEQGFMRSVLVSSFLMFILSGMLSYINLLNFKFPLLYLTIMAFIGLYLYMNKD